MIDMIALLALGIVMFMIGFYGLITKSDAVKIIISIEFMLIASNIVFIAFGYLNGETFDSLSQSYAILSLSIGGTIIGLALAVALILQKHLSTVNVGRLNTLRW